MGRVEPHEGDRGRNPKVDVGMGPECAGVVATAKSNGERRVTAENSHVNETTV